MIAYEFYLADEKDEFHLLGILPERRNDPLRITRESIFNWGKLIVGEAIDSNGFYFIQIEV
jgi:hypothetical protein